MLINSKDLLLYARDQAFAVPATNFIDLDSARTFVQVAEELNLPLILAFAQSHRHLISLDEAALIGNYLADQAKTPVVLHLDHGEDFDFIKRAIDLGFKSVMIDASNQDFQTNIGLSKQVVDYAHPLGVSVEAELGHVGSNDTNEGAIADSIYTEAEDVVDFVDATGVDSLAISIGTAHGFYKGKPHINFDSLDCIRLATQIPLVLHGGSSTGDDNLNRCATQGIAKINIFSDFLKGAMDHIQQTESNDYLTIKAAANQGMRETLTHYYHVFETKEFR